MEEQTLIQTAEQPAKKKPVLKSLLISLLLVGLAAWSVTQVVRGLIDLAVSLDLFEQEMLMYILPLRTLPFSVSPIPVGIGILVLWLPMYGFCAKRGFFRRFFLLIIILILLVVIWAACLAGLRIGLVSIIRLIFNFLQMSGNL